MDPTAKNEPKSVRGKTKLNKKDTPTRMKSPGKSAALKAKEQYIRRTTLKTKLKHRADELYALQEITLDITKSHNLPELLNTIVERAATILHASSGGLYLTEAEKRQVRCVVSYNTVRDFRGVVLKYGEGAAGRVAEMGQPLMIDDYDKWSGKASVFSQKGDAPFHSVISAPMIWQGRVTGVLHVLRDEIFTSEELELLILFANHAAIAVENARLYESLEQELRDRQQAEETTRRVETKYKTLIEKASDGFVLVAPEGKFKYASPSTQAMFGYTFEEIEKIDPADLTHPEDLPTVLQTFNRITEDPALSPTIQYRFLSKSGRWVWIESTFTNLLNEPGIEAFLINYHNINGQKLMEATLRTNENISRELAETSLRQAQELALLDKVRSIIASKLDMPALLKSVCEIIVEVYGYTHVSIYMREGDTLVLQYQIGYESVVERIGINEGISGQVARTGEPILIEDVSKSPLFIKAVDNLVSEITVPLLDNDRVVGTLSIESTGKLTQADLKTMIATSVDVGVAIGRARLYEDVQRRNRTLSALQEAALAIMGHLGLPDALQSILNQAGQLIDTNNGYIYLVQPNGKMELTTGMGVLSQFMGVTLEQGEGLAGRVWKTGQPLIVNDYLHWEGHSKKFENPPVYAAMGIPLLHGTEVRGVLGFSHLIPEKSFRNEDLDILSRFTQLASIAIDNASLYTKMLQELGEREEAEESLRASEQRFRSIFEKSPLGMGLIETSSGKFLQVNPRYCEIVGRTSAEMLDLHFVDITHPEDKGIDVSQMERLMKGEIRSFDFEKRYIRPDQSVVWAHLTIVALWGIGEKPKFHLTMVEDITEQKYAEQALRKNEQRLQAFFNQSLDGFFFCDFEEPIEWVHAEDKEKILDYIVANKRFTEVNDAMLNQYGISRENFLNLTTKDIFAHDPNQGRNLRRELFDNGYLHLETYERTSKDTPVWFEGDYVCLYDEEERITGFFGIQRDITERKHDESELRRHVQNSVTMYELSQNIHTGLDLDRVYQEAHRAVQKLMPCDAFLIALLNDEEQLIENVYIWDEGKRWSSDTQSPGEGVAGYVISSKVPLFVNEWNESYTELTNPVKFGNLEMDTQSVLAVPLFKMDGSCFGMISTQAYKTQSYTAEHEQLFVTLANQVSKAVDNANLFAKIQQELTERKRAEQALRESEERYRTLVTGMLDGVYRSTHEGKFVDVNPAMVKMFGYESREDMLDTDIKRDLYFSPDERHSLFLDIGQEKVDEFRMKRKDGSAIWVEDHGRYVHDEEGNVIFHEGILRDITERRLSEEALRRSEAFTKSIVENEPECVKIIDKDGKLQYMNPAGLAMIEVENMETLAGKSVLSIVDKPYRKAFTELVEKVLNGGQGTLQFEITGAKGTKRWLDTHAVPLYDGNGNVTSLLGLTRDITEKKQAESAIRDAEERYRSIFENAVEGIYQSSLEGRFHTVNPAFAAMMGYASPQDMVESVTDIAEQLYNDESRREDFIDLLEKQGRVTRFEYQMRRKDGKLIWVSENAHRVSNPDGTFHYEGILEDITARKQNEERIDYQIKQLNALHAIDTAINSNFDLRTTLEVLLREVIAQLNVDAASVLLFNKETHTLDYTAGRGFLSKATQHTKLSAGEGYAGRVILERKMTHIPDLTKTDSPLSVALSLAGENFIAYVGSPLIAKGQAVGVLEIFQRSPLTPDPDWFDYLSMLADQAAIAIENAQLFENLQRSNFELTLAYDATIEGWSRALDLRDRETEGHTQRVTNLTVKLARQMGISDTDILHIRRGALLHDIGKMGIPDSILHKPDKLTPEEWDIMRQHADYAYKMLSPIDYLKPALDIPRYHHEKWDGTGYPDGLKGEHIPIAARIFAVIDVWDALISDRDYREAWSKEKAIEYIRSESGKHFDPKVVENFLTLILDT
ncbi:MAG: PAS domain S-box protein [Anaerolineales bacterium]|nr:PAS domain S-box protein [Anaerolineales bacterium]